MSTTCQICGGAIPRGELTGGHTALCAGVIGEELNIAIAALQLIAGTNGTECAYPRAEAEEALRLMRAVVSPEIKTETRGCAHYCEICGGHCTEHKCAHCEQREDPSTEGEFGVWWIETTQEHYGHAMPIGGQWCTDEGGGPWRGSREEAESLAARMCEVHRHEYEAREIE